MSNLKVKTIEPDFRFKESQNQTEKEAFEAWQRHIISELFMASNKVTWIKAQELFQPRIKNQLFA